MEKEFKVIKEGVHAFTHDGIIFTIAGLDFVEAVNSMPPETWNLIQRPNSVKLYRAQGAEDVVKNAFLASGYTIERIYQVVDGECDFSFLDHEKEPCLKCGKTKNVGMQCDCEYWSRDVPVK